MSENDLVERLLSGDRRALARIISRIEGEDSEVREMISELYPHTGEAVTIGFTGPPGVGKSSIIARLIELYREEDKKRSEEHTSELQSRQYLVCRLLLEKKKLNSSHANIS